VFLKTKEKIKKQNYPPRKRQPLGSQPYYTESLVKKPESCGSNVLPMGLIFPNCYDAGGGCPGFHRPAIFKK